MRQPPTYLIVKHSVKKESDFSIRDYAPLIEAQITVVDSDYKTAVNKGFKELFKFSRNGSKKNIKEIKN